MLKGANVVLGVTGGIACYKSCEIVSRLVKLGVNVDVIMTANSREFVTPLTFESLSHNAVTTDTFKRSASYDIKHVSLAQKADVILIAPATANIIAKIACGIADDMLSTTVLASQNSLKIICPAMNTGMYNNVICKENIAKLKSLGYIIVEPSVGRLACGDVGVGKMAEPESIVEKLQLIMDLPQDLANKSVLITVGGTEEPIDAVRVITNRSSGKMGVAVANECIARGAKVLLIAGNVSVDLPNAAEIIMVKTTDDMFNAVMNNYENCDYIIKAAAPSDYKVVDRQNNKIKTDKLNLNLEKNIDIAATVGKVKGNRKLVVFSAETDDLIQNSIRKLHSKYADIVVANDVSKQGAGFNSDTNIVSIITADENVAEYGIMTKREVAKIIVDTMVK